MSCSCGQAATAHLLARRIALLRGRKLGRGHEHQARDGGHVALADWLGAVQGFTALHWACESRDAARVRATLRGDGGLDVAARCGSLGNGPTSLELASDKEAFPHEPSPVCAKTAALVRAALQPWSPQVHHVQTAAFRRAAFAVMCVCVRLRGGAARGGRRRSRRMAVRAAAVAPALPAEMWHQVLACCAREWWG
jgi:hypothetical protein